MHLGCNKEVAGLLRYVASSSGFTGRGLEGEAATIARFGKPHQLVRPISRSSSGGICLGGSQAPP